MPKTQFSHGMVVTPEFLNAINNPSYADSPSADGQIPFPSMGLSRLADVEDVTGAELTGFLKGLGYGQPQGAPAPVTGEQVRALVEAFGDDADSRDEIIAALLFALRYPLQKVPIYLAVNYSSAPAPAFTLRTPHLANDISLGAVQTIELIPDSPGYKQSFARFGNPNVAQATSSYHSGWNALSSLANATLLSSPFPLLDVSPGVERVQIALGGGSDAASGANRVLRIGLVVDSADDTDFTLPLSFIVSSQYLAQTQFTEIGFSVFDSRAPGVALRYAFELSDFFYESQFLQLRFKRVGTVLKAASGARDGNL